MGGLGLWSGVGVEHEGGSGFETGSEAGFVLGCVTAVEAEFGLRFWIVIENDFGLGF